MSQKDFQEAHKTADVDAERSSYHHTLGKGANQAAPGNHVHLSTKVQADETMLGSNQSIVGTQDVITFAPTVEAANEIYVVTLNVSYDISGSANFDVKLNKNTVNELGGIAVSRSFSCTDSVSRTWKIINPPVGTLTLKMRVIENSGDVTIRGFDSTIQCTRYYNA